MASDKEYVKSIDRRLAHIEEQVGFIRESLASAKTQNRGMVAVISLIVSALISGVIKWLK